MPPVDQMLRAAARAHPGTPYWVLENDYALGYLLAGMSQVAELQALLVLKGGTALRKFYFAGYRFSEDLDFTALRPISDMYAMMRAAIGATQAVLLERGPFALSVERLTLRDPHPGGQEAFTVRMRFPSHREPLCRLKVEITYDEEVVLSPVAQSLLHGYPEAPIAEWHCYTLEEIVAEKLRALLQSRARLRDRGWGASRVCRDYYDLWYILGHGAISYVLLPDLLARKCFIRGVASESKADFLAPELLSVAQAEWERQLRPFVPAAPPVTQVLNELALMLAKLSLIK